MPIKSRIRTIPDYPKPGIMFRDITSLLEDAQGFRKVIDELIYPFVGKRIDKVAGIEARGFILGGAVAHQLSVGFVPVRKRGKLPRDTIREAYDLEYGKDEVEIHADAIAKGENILLIDDLIATGGTAAAAAKLVTRLGGRVAG
jgi:adenine phosphoribosyltransferase